MESFFHLRYNTTIIKLGFPEQSSKLFFNIWMWTILLESSCIKYQYQFSFTSVRNQVELSGAAEIVFYIFSRPFPPLPPSDSNDRETLDRSTVAWRNVSVVAVTSKDRQYRRRSRRPGRKKYDRVGVTKGGGQRVTNVIYISVKRRSHLNRLVRSIVRKGLIKPASKFLSSVK